VERELALTWSISRDPAKPSAMTTSPETLLELTMTVATITILASGLALWLRLRRRGGLELGLAHVVADPARRRTFIVALSASLASFLGAGLVEGWGNLVPAMDAVADLAGAALFTAGAAGILVLVANGLRPTPLSLQEEWRLREAAEQIDLPAGGRASYAEAPEFRS
jgi:hypothetical protein